ncbi:MAG: BatA and WFA domain-containing protein [Acidobacteriota bacterium]
MQFLNPLFWLGALAVAAPVLIHLVHKEKSTRIPFASLMLMPRVPVKQMQRRRLKHLFLLLLRCLGILFLVGAFAGPVATGDWLSKVSPLSARSVLILIDHSLSMSRPGVWARALEAAEAKIRSLADSDEGLLVQFGEKAEVVSLWEEGPGPLLQALKTRITPSFESTSYLQGLRLAVDQFEGKRKGSKQIYLITDLQRTGLSATQGWKVPPDVDVELEDVGQENSNLFVQEVRAERDLFSKAYPHPILARLAASPPQPLKGEAQLFIEEKLVDRQSFQLSEEGTAQVTFGRLDFDEGPSRGRIVVESGDPLPQDNVSYFVVERKSPRKVLLFSPRGRSSALYLRSALSAGANLPFQVEVSAQIPPALNLERTPLVILNDLKTPPGRSLLEPFVEQGGSLILVLGSNVRSEVYNRRWKGFLPAQLVERHFVRSRAKPFTSMTRISWDHPVFQVFRDVHKAAIADTQFYSYWRLQPGRDASVLGRFDEGDAALVERLHGQGRIMVFASSVNPVWTDFPMRSAFVPFWQQMVQYAGGWKATPAAFRIGQVLPAPGSAGPGRSMAWSVLDPAGRRVTGLEERNPAAVPLERPGYYEIRNNKGTDWVAVNLPPAESDLTRIAAREMLAVFVPGGQSRVAGSAGTATIGKAERKQPIWGLFLLLAALVLAAESSVANRTPAAHGEKHVVSR